MTTKFCTVDQVKAHMTMDASYTGHDAMIEQQIITATSLIRAATRRTWDLGTYIDHFSTQDVNVALGVGNDFASFTLKEKPLTAVNSVKFNTAGDWTNTEELESDLYEVEASRNRIVIYATQMLSHGRALRVEYTAGYAADETDAELLNVLSDLQVACALQAAFQTERILNEAKATSSRSNKTGGKTYLVRSNGLIAEAQALIRGQTRILVGGRA